MSISEQSLQDFVSLPLIDKKNMVLSILEPYATETGEDNISTVYRYILNYQDDITEEYLIEVFQGILRTVDDIGLQQADAMQKSLHTSRERIRAMHAQEAAEHENAL